MAETPADKIALIDKTSTEDIDSPKLEESNVAQGLDSKTDSGINKKTTENEVKPIEVKASPKKQEAKPVEIKASPKKQEAKPIEIKASPKKPEAKPIEVKASSNKQEAKPIEKEPSSPINMTLLEKALYYRQHNPEKWKSRQRDSEKIVNESYGIYEDDPFLTEYYRRLDEIKEEGLKYQEERKLLPPKLIVQLQFNLPRENLARKTSSTSLDTYARFFANGVSVFDKDESFFDKLKNSANQGRGDEPELLISVSKGKNLLNGITDRKEKYKECRIKCKVFPDSNKRDCKLKSGYVFVNAKGTTKWNYVFVMKGFTAEQLSNKYIRLEVAGKNSDGKKFIGEAMLAGKNASIAVKGFPEPISPVESEFKPWQEAIEKPGSNVTVNLDLQKGLPEGNSRKNSLTSLLRNELGGKLNRRGSIRRPSRKASN